MRTKKTKANDDAAPAAAPAINATSPTHFPGMGAVLQNGGCVYRVWAPFATGVSVGGDFFHRGNIEANDWREVPMARDAPGSPYWSVFIDGVLADSLYKFRIDNDGAQPGTHATSAVTNDPSPYKHDPYARDATRSGGDGNDVVVDRYFDWSGDDFQMPPWNELVIYELHIGTFNKAGNTVGTFAEAIGKLDYVAGLGVNAIEVMPAFDFDTETSMGYNPSLPFAMDNAYGSLTALKTFVKEAHKRGLAVILDVVYNHFGPDGLNAGLGRIDGWWINDRRGVYFYDDVRAWTDYGDTRPDFGRPEVRQYLIDHVMTCLRELHADGLRLDSTINIRQARGKDNVYNGDIPDGWTLLRWIGEEKRRAEPWKILIAEDLQNDSTITRDAYFGGMGLDSQWDAWFRGRVRDAITAGSDDARSTGPVAEAISASYTGAGPFQRVVYIESHDEAHARRLPDIISPGNSDSYYAKKLTMLGAAITFTSPGIPMIFMGQEFLEWRRFADGTGDFPLDWTRVSSCAGIVDFYRRLIQLRRNWNNNTRGLRGAQVNVFHQNPSAGIIAYHRYDQGGPGDDVVVVVNLKGQRFDSYNVGFPRPGNWYLRLNSDWTNYSRLNGNAGYDTTAAYGWNQNMPRNGNVGIGPYSAIILSQ